MSELIATKINLIDLDINQRNVMYNLYVESYKTDRWYQDSTQLFNAYKCALVYTNNKNVIVGYFMLINTKFGKKISLSAIINDNRTKQLMFNERAKLLVTPGYYQEADGPVSWILRSRYNLHPITNEEHIKTILQDKINKGDVIIMNSWKFNDKTTQVYTRITTDGDKIFKNNESIYGIPCSISSNPDKKPIFSGFVEYENIGNQCESNCEIKQFGGDSTSNYEKYVKYKERYVERDNKKIEK